MATPQPSDEPYSDEDEALAESIVDRAIEKYRGTVPSALFDEMREHLVTDMLATSEGRKKLWAFKADTAKVDKSADLEIHPSAPSAEDEKKTGGT